MAEFLASTILKNGVEVVPCLYERVLVHHFPFVFVCFVHVRLLEDRVYVTSRLHNETHVYSSRGTVGKHLRHDGKSGEARPKQQPVALERYLTSAKAELAALAPRQDTKRLRHLPWRLGLGRVGADLLNPRGCWEFTLRWI